MDDEIRIVVDGRAARIIRLLDENGERTEDPTAARKVLYQFDEHKRPEGTMQEYKVLFVPDGLTPLALN